MINGACIPPSCSSPLVSPLFLTLPPLQPTFFSSTSTFLPSRHFWWLCACLGFVSPSWVFSASEGDELKFSWAYLHLSCQNLSPDPPGALGDHVVPSPIFLTLFSWEGMVQGVRVFNILCGWERRKGIELLGWEVLTAPYKLGFQRILSVQRNCQEFPSPLLFLSLPVHLCLKVSSEMLEFICSIKICHSQDAVQLVCQKKRCHGTWGPALLDGMLNGMLEDFKSTERVKPGNQSFSVVKRPFSPHLFFQGFHS